MNFINKNYKFTKIINKLLKLWKIINNKKGWIDI